MTTGLDTFDAFSWASLLAGRQALVIDRDAARGTRTGAALEEAGAVATLAPGQVIGADRLRDSEFGLVVLGLGADEDVADKLAMHFPGLGGRLLVLVDAPRQTEMHKRFPAARIGGHGMSDRDLVMFITRNADE